MMERNWNFYATAKECSMLSKCTHHLCFMLVLTLHVVCSYFVDKHTMQWKTTISLGENNEYYF